ncbi:hypothetical protein E2C01_094866 [Portunus trituberculatus]|uniref:Uncharacterized protein n=1 Tax=Portunus trituberculatus TaxID=210409 RepID=A0A5B7JYC4_PORTR|nr:hypothetical protein [Portunus trituberculatus]
MMSLQRLRDSRDFSPYSSSAECADEDKTSSSALSKADVEVLAVAGSARFTGLKKEDMEEEQAVEGSTCFTGLKKEDMEEGPAVEPSAADVEASAVAGSACVTGMACLTGLKNE